MKPEDALKYLKDFIDNEEPKIGAYNTEVLKNAIDALEYRVPKKPHKFQYETMDGTCCVYVCDDCGYVLDETKDDFCPNCGQAIEWSDNYDK